MSEHTVEPDRLSVSYSSYARDLWIYRATGKVLDPDERDRAWPLPPPNRRFTGGPDVAVPEFDASASTRRLGRAAAAGPMVRELLDQINYAITLARPLLITGRPGSGKTTLAYSIARELGLGNVLHWSLSPRSSTRSGLYEYDAVGHSLSMQAGERRSVGDFVRLGLLGTALLPYGKPRVLLLDGVDRTDYAFQYELLPLIDDGGFEIPELIRVRDQEPEVAVHTADLPDKVAVEHGVVQCHSFPLFVMTVDGDREPPPALVRRCVRAELPEPSVDELRAIADAHFPEDPALVVELVERFDKRRAQNGAADFARLLDALHMIRSNDQLAADPGQWPVVLRGLWRDLTERA